MDEGNKFAGAHAAGFKMGNPGGVGRVENIHIKGEIDRWFKGGHRYFTDVTDGFHLISLHPKTPRLSKLMAVRGPDADLNQTTNQPFFHDPRHGACVRKVISLVNIIEIGMGIEVNQSHWSTMGSNCLDNGIGYRMVSPKHEQAVVFRKDIRNSLNDTVKSILPIGIRHIPHIRHLPRPEDIPPRFTPHIHSPRPESLPYPSRSFGCPTKKG